MHTANWSIYYIWYLIGLCQGQKTLCLTLVSKNSLIHSSLGHIFNDEYTPPHRRLKCSASLTAVCFEG